MARSFHERRSWFDRYHEESLAGMREPLPYLSELYTCPCCGYPMLSERESYEICLLCWWEDEFEDDPHLDRVSGPNHITLREGRANFERHLISCPTGIASFRECMTNRPMPTSARRWRPSTRCPMPPLPTRSSLYWRLLMKLLPATTGC